tara:strand:- start:78 stop:1016 length:939 start_codon:yes stop_codon:yes gene_type:complete
MRQLFVILAISICLCTNAQFIQGTGGSGSNISSGATSASGSYATAMGRQSNASGYASTVSGYQSVGSGSKSVAFGDHAVASAEYAIAFGSWSTASGSSAIAIGQNNTASGNRSTAIGYRTTAIGNRSAAFNTDTKASDYASTVIGSFNLVGKTVTSDATNFNLNNSAFVVGNGYEDNSDPFSSTTIYSDAFVVYFNGNATLSGDLTINSDARLKDNIQPLGTTLSKLHKIEGKTYTMKRDEEKKQKIGVLAQDIEKVFPELVSEGSDGILSVNYQGLVPVLINSINEQQNQFVKQQAEIDALKVLIKKLTHK